MSWSGDISQMGQLADRVADLANVPSRASKAVAFDLEGFLQEEFDRGEDPYGEPWVPLADATLDRGRTPPPLTDTTAMRSSAKVRPLPGAGVAMSVDHPGAPHQTGWHGPRGDGPARPILPALEALPERWEQAIDREVEKAVRR